LPSIAPLVDVRIPTTALVQDLKALKRWFTAQTGTVVLKSDHSWGGWGVRVAHSLNQVDAAFRSMTGMRRLVLSLKLLCSVQDPEWFLHLVKRHRPTLTVQSYIRGTPANCSVACWQGDVLAGIAIEALVTKGPTGSATVVRLIHNHEMMDVAARLVRYLGATGIFGFDFILEEGTNRAFLLEINPRATQISHLAFGPERNLAAAICARITGNPVENTAPSVPAHLLIAFFPQELKRDPSGSLLKDAYHDVPYEEPALVEAFLAKDGLMRRSKLAVRAMINRVMPVAQTGVE